MDTEMAFLMCNQGQVDLQLSCSKADDWLSC